MENKALDQFINEWKTRTTKYYLDLKQESAKVHDDARGMSYDDRMAYFEANWWRKHPKSARTLAEGHSENQLIELIEKDAQIRKADFLKRITKKVGALKEVNLYMAENCEINGTAKGEDGEATVRSIIAGGYNIQRVHYRVLVK